jgi:hypothetical protein
MNHRYMNRGAVAAQAKPWAWLSRAAGWGRCFEMVVCYAGDKAPGVNRLTIPGGSATMRPRRRGKPGMAPPGTANNAAILFKDTHLRLLAFRAS